MAEVYSHPIMALNTSLRACSAVIDILIAVIMSYYLMKQGIPKIPRYTPLFYFGSLAIKLTPSVGSSRKMYFRLISLTVSTGIWTAIVATADFCLMAAYQEQLYYTIFEFPLCSLYVSVLLANLNSREFVKGSEEPWQGVSPSRRSISTIPVRGTVGAAEDYPPSQAMMMLDLTPSVDGKFKHDTVDFSPKMASNYLTV
ncbi:uncharacterized protein FIBRA_03264 [Fibroporia radiculosa]|uniref:DUF6534 domain-containing protein n=1 Tax=Fibroporia radiculosa TaxID=599839 RepID=J4I9I4_9APHY|nr:uncharacterized protein FIBRA_03264 [Fibroporia radiculosa]CCM01216.1 predicted protein [Fibroporia radiculosa]